MLGCYVSCRATMQALSGGSAFGTFILCRCTRTRLPPLHTHPHPHTHDCPLCTATTSAPPHLDLGVVDRLRARHAHEADSVAADGRKHVRVDDEPHHTALVDLEQLLRHRAVGDERQVRHLRGGGHALAGTREEIRRTVVRCVRVCVR